MALTDADLVARVILDDDRHAFAEIVRRHQSTVRLLLRRLCGGDAALADDLAQEVFLRAYRSLRQWRQAARLSSWLYRIAYNMFASDRAKTERRATLPVADVPERAGAGMADASHIKRDLERALQRLPEGERAAVVLTCVHGVTHEEAAEILGCPVGTVKTHVHRGRKRLREALECSDV